METVKNLVAGLCSSFVFFGIIMLIIPSGTMKRSIKMLIGIAITASFVISFSNTTFSMSEIADFNGSTYLDSSNFSDVVFGQQINSVKTSVKNVVLESFKENKIFNTEVDVITNISEDGNISITVVEVVCDSADAEKVKTICKELGLNSNVTERITNDG